MKKLYQNYNSVFLDRKGRVVKIFKDDFCWRNETRSNPLFRAGGIPCPEILQSRHLVNVYPYFTQQSYTSQIKNETKLEELVKMALKIGELPPQGFYSFSGYSEKLVREAERLIEQGVINPELLNKLRRLSEVYSCEDKRVTHGDFRPDNILGQDEISAVIDLEFSGVNDPHKDLAYLWVGCVEREKESNHFLKRRFSQIDFFNPTSFLFWQAYVHVMIMLNPLNQNKQQWGENLAKLIENVGRK